MTEGWAPGTLFRGAGYSNGVFFFGMLVPHWETRVRLGAPAGAGPADDLASKEGAR
jgi:hypothetical protein